MSTTRLHLDDSWLRRFEARVSAHRQWGDKPSLWLEASAFYPESGGQMADHGTLTSLPLAAAAVGTVWRVTDVQLDPCGEVHHLIEGQPPAVGTRVVGEVDKARRRIHMAQHTGQHLLSRALMDVAGAATVSSRLGETACTIDTDSARLSEAQLERAEALVNAIIEDDVSVALLYPDAAQLAEMDLRRPAKVEHNIRVVKIGDFDITPCGGTHVSRTAQVGWVRVTQLERHKGGKRITFAAGSRAREKLTFDSRVATELAQGFSCGVGELAEAVAKLQRQSGEMRRELTAAREQLARELAARYAAAAEGPLWVRAFADLDAQVVRRLASQLCAQPGRALALAAKGQDGLQVVIARSEDRDLDCGQLLRRVASACGGRGGGRPQRAEGKLPAGVDWPQLVKRAYGSST